VDEIFFPPLTLHRAWLAGVPSPNICLRSGVLMHGVRRKLGTELGRARQGAKKETPREAQVRSKEKPGKINVQPEEIPGIAPSR
jgi:hypothetical protein